MTTYVTATYSYARTAQTNTDFRLILSKWKEALDGCGLVQTADTGQLDPATATYPGVANTEAGYWIYRFNDSQQSVDPIFFRLGIGRGTGHAGTTYIRLTVGQGSNGAGTITGTTVGPINLQNSYTNSGGTATVHDKACHVNGWAFFSYFWEHNLPLGPFVGYFGIARMRDQVTGAFNGKGILLTYQPENSSNTISFMRWRSVRFASPATVYNENRGGAIMPGAPASTSLTNGDKQLYPHWYNVPDIEQAWATFTVRNSEFGQPALAFTAAPMYGQSRTFLHPGHGAISPTYTVAANSVDSTTWGPCFLWE